MGDQPAVVEQPPEPAPPTTAKAGVLSKVFAGRPRKKSQDAPIDVSVVNVSRSRKGSKIEHNPDFFEADEDISSSVEPTPRTQNLSIDEEDAREALEATINIPAPSPAERKQPTSPTQRSPRADSGGEPTNRRASMTLVLNTDFLHTISAAMTPAAPPPSGDTAEVEHILSALPLPPPPPSPPSPPAEDSKTLAISNPPLSPTARSPNAGPSTTKTSAVSFFGIAAVSPRAYVDSSSTTAAADAAGGPSSTAGGEQPSAREDSSSSPPPPPLGSAREGPGGVPTNPLMMMTMGAAGHATTTGGAETDARRMSMRIMAPLMRRYSQEIKTGAFTITTARTKEKKQIDAAINRFNQKPLAGIDMLVSAGIIKRTPEDVAAFIRQKGSDLSKRRVGELVGGLDPFCQEVLRILLQEYDFTGMSLDQAMRVLIMDIRFPGESQMIDRIIERFSQRYYECNESAFATQDTVHILSFSLIMLNTDLHNRNLNPRKKMKLEDFIRNNRGINDGQDLPRELLEALYNEIKSHELRMKEGDMYESDILTFMAPRLSGWLWKKSEGTFAQWKRHWFVLTGGCVYYFAAPQHPTPRCIIPLDSVTAAKGSSSVEIILYSNFGTVIKSVKIVEGRMVQGDHRRYVLRAADSAERDEWVEALQRETVVPLVELDRLKATNQSALSTGSMGRSPKHQISNVSSATSNAGAKSPRVPRGHPAVVHETLFRCLAEGWMRRRSDVSRSWQRRYFMLMVNEKKKDRRVMLHYFTTQEMGQRMVDMGVSTDQGAIPMSEVTAFRIKTPADVINYRPPDAKATVFEVEYDRYRELVSPEDDVSLQYWLDALRPVIGVHSTTV